MAKKDSASMEPDVPMTHEEWLKQVPCPDCGGRPGYDPETGVELKNGHHESCQSK